MGWLIALGICLLLLIVLLVSPVGFSLRYNATGFHIHFLAGLVRIPIPVKKIIQLVKDLSQQKEKEPQKPKEPKPKKETPQKPKQEEEGGSWTDFLPMLRLIPEVLNDIRRKIRVNYLQMRLILAGDDPCDLALNYGRTWAAIGNVMPHLERYFVIKKKDIAVDCDYLASETVVTARLDATMTPARMLLLSMRFLYRAVSQLIDIMNSRKGGASK